METTRTTMKTMTDGRGSCDSRPPPAKLHSPPVLRLREACNGGHGQSEAGNDESLEAIAGQLGHKRKAAGTMVSYSALGRLLLIFLAKTCERRDSNSHPRRDWILSAEASGQGLGTPPTETYRSVLSSMLHEQKYDEKYDECS
jgi:hypothetical protein